MSTTIKLEYDGKDYVLGFDRRTVQQMSDAGFSAAKFQADPIGSVLPLFHGAFLLYNRTLSSKEIDTIWESMPDKDGLMDVLIDMYGQGVKELFADPGATAKKGRWEVVK